MSEAPIPPELEQAYRQAVYQVDTGAGGFRLRLDRPNPALVRLYGATGEASAVFITAYNPRSRPTDTARNHAAQARLAAALAEVSEHVLAAEGRDPTGDWPPEPAYLALGVAREAARALGAALGQNAVVWAGADAVPELVWCLAPPAR